MENAENEGALKQSDQSLGAEFPQVRERRATRFTRWSTGVAVRIFIWYALITALFRCPSHSDELDGLSPRVCQPYLAARSHLDPFVKPYYDAYAAPYVEVIGPYAHNFDKNIYSPSKSFAAHGYHTYGAPGLEKSTRFLHAQWNTAVTPRIHNARDALIQSYGAAVQPQVRKIEAIIAPRYQSAATAVAQVRDTHFTPYYSQIRSGSQGVYYIVHGFVTDHALPRGRWVWSVVARFVNGTLRPHVAGLYLRNVEPQLDKIGKKLASYREGKDPQWAVEESQSYSSTDATIDSTSSLPTITETHTQTEETTTTTQSTTSSTGPSQREIAEEKIASDLKAWQEKFAKAADKGCEDLEEQIVAIVQNQVENGPRSKGENLLKSVESVAQNELEGLKTKILQIIDTLPEEVGQAEIDAAEDELVRSLRASGTAIRDPAHSLRQWFDDYDKELLERVTAAVSSTLEVLDSIRNLGLQKIGMSWAWMDGVTYKDWAKYHATKKQFSEWRDEVRDVGMQHESFVNARAAGSDLLARGMTVAENTAKELTRLKKVGKWKIEAGESSDDFENKAGDPAEYRAERRAALELERAQSLEAGEEEPTTPAGNREEDIFSEDRRDSTSSLDDGHRDAIKSEDAMDAAESANVGDHYHSEKATETPTASDSLSGEDSSETQAPQQQDTHDTTQSFGYLPADVDDILRSTKDRFQLLIDSAARGIDEMRQTSEDDDYSVLDAAAADLEEVLESSHGWLVAAIRDSAENIDDYSEKLGDATDRLNALSGEAHADWRSLSAKYVAEDSTTQTTPASEESTASSAHEEL